MNPSKKTAPAGPAPPRRAPQRRQPALGPLVRVPPAHRGDPPACRDVLTPGRQHLLDFPDGARVLQGGDVKAGAVGHPHAVEVRLDDSRHDGAPAEIHDPNIRSRNRRWATHGCEAAVADRHGVDDRALCVHRVNPAVDEGERRLCLGTGGLSAL